MMINARLMMLLVLVLAAGTRAATAQGPGRQGLTSPASRSQVVPDVRTRPEHAAARSVFADSTSIPPSHWKTGAIIGGAIGFPLGFLAFASVNDGTTAQDIGAGLLGGLGIAAIFGMIGGLIGSFFHR
jgi:hypothetical protein